MQRHANTTGNKPALIKVQYGAVDPRVCKQGGDMLYANPGSLTGIDVGRKTSITLGKSNRRAL